jgi:hypothetical protein
MGVVLYGQLPVVEVFSALGLNTTYTRSSSELLWAEALRSGASNPDGFAA